MRLAADEIELLNRLGVIAADAADFAELEPSNPEPQTRRDLPEQRSMDVRSH